ATQQMYEEQDEPMTINGIHLNELGNKLVAQFISKTLCGTDGQVKSDLVDSVRKAVVEKNEYWFQKYRATSGNEVWGTRSIQDGNYNTLQRELEMLDVLTRNRDPKIWALAQGDTYEVDDSNVPEPLIVGTHITRHVEYIDGEAAIDRMTIPSDLQVNLY